MLFPSGAPPASVNPDDDWKWSGPVIRPVEIESEVPIANVLVNDVANDERMRNVFLPSCSCLRNDSAGKD
jgi:hypothetical protein